MKKVLILPVLVILLNACGNGRMKSDASGIFEADEVIVSSEIPGKLLSFKVDEGMLIPKDSIVGTVDAENLTLQKEQVAASVEALSQRTSDVNPQVKLLQDQLIVQESQLKTFQREKLRTENLLKQDAATEKQLDDINSQIDVAEKQILVTRQQINVQRSNTGTQNRGILSEAAPLKKRIAQLDDQLKRASIINPIQGTVLSTYVEEGEVVGTGKALYKIADLSYVNLRAYITGEMLPAIKLEQQVTVLIDSAKDNFKTYNGTITWIADKAEFTPKTIQTREERANLVYAVKVKVKNDGYLKLGMYGEVRINQKSE